MINMKRRFSRKGSSDCFSCLRLPILCFFVSLCLQPGLVAEESLETILDRTRQALGHAKLCSFENGIVVLSEGVSKGLESRFTLYLKKDGCFRLDTHSALESKVGFDGRKGWFLDASRMPGYLEFRDLEVLKMIYGVLGGHWLIKEGQVNLSLMESSRDADGTVRINASFPEGLIAYTISMDSETALPKEMTWQQSGATHSLSLADYRKVSGFRFPHKVVLQKGNLPMKMNVQCVRECRPEEADAYQAIVKRPEDTVFSAPEAQPLEIKKIGSGHLLVKVELDGGDAGWFFLDTGAGLNCVDRSLADKLGLESHGEITVKGVGGEQQVAYRKSGRMRAGYVTINDPWFIEVELASIGSMIGCDLGGILGYNFFTRTLVELDLKTEEVRFFPPDAWKNREAPWQELIFDKNIPSVVCTLENGLKGLYHLDTGSGATVELHSGFIARHKLLENREVTNSGTLGVGGMITTKTGRLDEFVLGGHRFENPQVTFANTDRGIFHDDGAAGNIGTGFLSHFRLLIDYPGKRIAFIKDEDS